MLGWEQRFTIEPAGDRPRFVQIAQALVAEVRRGRLRPGDPLPSSRALAQSLGVHRNTILAAYAELRAEGWIVSEPARGTFVSQALPDPSPRRFAPSATLREQVPARAAFDLPPAIEPFRFDTRTPPGTIALPGGVPDVGLVPAALLARAYRRALQRDAKALLGYRDPAGHPALRAALATMLSATRGLAADADSLLPTRGSQMALFLVAQLLVRPGDVVAVEDPGYRPAWEALRRAGARLVPIKVDADGLVVDELAALVARERVRAVYLTPHHQYPSTVTLAPGRRLELLRLARGARMAVIEDDYDHEFHYEGRPVLPLASTDAAGSVIYVGTLSKVLAPGLRLGYVVAPPPLLARLVVLRSTIDLQGDAILEAAVAELIADGEVQRQVRRARRAYHARRDALAAALHEQLGDAVSFTTPGGGMALWLRARDDIKVAAWERGAAAHGVQFQPGSRFAFDGRECQQLRVGFAGLEERKLREAARRLAAGLEAARRR
ncbi:PLP-dependent aminotransferase family protein [Nannocystis sp.]|uniref:MocR-like pyridoxine biosynthesis transcription factor PdxR n=1 Tax=Nannocystis sp. TaxID=1962667 RepID=UPI0025E3CCF0|nr:PLP-dependent aminotransferase family protein [Nannocystis sp.]MBK7830601.1 PLP-dependent aminotransferase family protein [Nannocystis sp.]